MLCIQRRLMVLLCCLYYLQGIPYGIQVKSLPMYSLDVLKYSLDSVTKLSLLMSPWIFLKPVLVCCVNIPQNFSYMLSLSLCANVFLSVILYQVFTLNLAYFDYIHLLPFFLINCFTVLMDVCTDQLAIISAVSVSDIKFFGISNSIQIIAYKFGASFSEIVLHIFGYENMSFIFVIQGLLYLIVLHYMYNLFKRNWKRIISIDPKCCIKTSVNLNEILKRTFFLKTNAIFVIYLLTYKLGESGVLTLSPLVLYDMSIDRFTLAQLTIGICEPLSLAGSVVGGFLVSFCKGNSVSLLNLLIVFSLLRSFPLLLQFIPFNPFILLDSYLYEVSRISLPMLSFLGGVVSTLTFTVMMMVACMTGKNSYAPYTYSLFSSVEVLGKLIFSSYTGYFSTLLGKSFIYIMFLFSNLFATLILVCFKSRLICYRCGIITIDKCD